MTDADVPTDGIITSTRRQWSRQISIGATLESCFLHFPLQIESILMNNARWSMCSEISQESYCALNGWQARTLLLRIICDSLQHIWLVWNVNWKTALPSLEITSAIILYLKFWKGVVSCGKKKRGHNKAVFNVKHTEDRWATLYKSRIIWTAHSTRQRCT